MPHRNLIVIGGSTGGLEAVRRILSALPADLDAAVCLVLHTSAESPGIVDRILGRVTRLTVKYADEGDMLRPGCVYVARADRHLVIKGNRVRIPRGPRENRFRPAVDPLFRTAATSHGRRVIGVVLSGGQNDGAVGLALVKRRGGVAIVQDPDEALAPSMPQAALRHLSVDHVLPLDAIAPALVRLVQERIDDDVQGADEPAPDVAEGEQDDIHRAATLGPPSPLSCPDCGGVLWEFRDEELLQYHCHLGHRFSGESLVSAQAAALDAAMWSALRALEEHSALHARMAVHARDRGMHAIAEGYDEQARESEQRARVIRRVLLTGLGDDDAPAVRLVPNGTSSS